MGRLEGGLTSGKTSATSSSSDRHSALALSCSTHTRTHTHTHKHKHTHTHTHKDTPTATSAKAPCDQQHTQLFLPTQGTTHSTSISPSLPRSPPLTHLEELVEACMILRLDSHCPQLLVLRRQVLPSPYAPHPQFPTNQNQKKENLILGSEMAVLREVWFCGRRCLTWDSSRQVWTWEQQHVCQYRTWHRRCVGGSEGC
eukprot:3665046-Rhodomonas_salina.3